MTTKPIGAPPSNTELQRRAREVRGLLGTYVTLHYGYIQADSRFVNWRERSRKTLERASELLERLRADDARTGLLAALAGTAFERARCLEAEDETIMDARRRGSAAEAASGLAEALRTGDLVMAWQLRRELIDSMNRMGAPE